MQTPRLGLHYPEGTNLPQLAYWSEALAEALDSAFAYRHMQQGEVNVQGTGTDDAYTDLSFPFGAFTTAPTVLVAVVSGSNNFVATVGEISTSGARIRVGTTAATSFSNSVSVSWIACNF